MVESSVAVSGVTVPVNRPAIPTMVFMPDSVCRAMVMVLEMMAPGPAMFVISRFMPLLIMAAAAVVMEALFSRCVRIIC